MENNNVVYDGELTHWGIKGMRWGIRRYQNKDGSLTPAGKKKLRAEQAKVREQEAINKKRKSVQASFDRLEARKKAAEDEKKALDEAERTKLGKGKKRDDDGKKNSTTEEVKATPKKKSVKDMTDEELVNAIARKRLENEYDRLNPEQTQQGANAVQSAQKSGFMKKMWDEAVVPAAVQGGKNLLNTAMSEGIKKLFKEPVDPDSFEALDKVAKKFEAQARTAKAKFEIDKYGNPDKYMSEEDKKKRQEREHAAEDREAQKRGYKDSIDEANQNRIKREADASRRSQIEYEEYQKAYARSTDLPDNSSFRRGVNAEPKTPTLTLGQRTVSGLLSSGSTAIARGRSAVKYWDDGDYVDVTNDPTYPGNKSSSSAIALGQRAIAGLLPAPKDDD